MTFKELAKSLEDAIEASYTEGVTMEEAERLAGRFLHAQMQVSQELKNASLDARMRKAGVKALRAAVYKEAAAPADGKKPTEAALAAIIDSHDVVQSESERFDIAECDRDDLDRYYSIFREAHIFFRGISKGKFDP